MARPRQCRPRRPPPRRLLAGRVRPLAVAPLPGCPTASVSAAWRTWRCPETRPTVSTSPAPTSASRRGRSIPTSSRSPLTRLDGARSDAHRAYVSLEADEYAPTTSTSAAATPSATPSPSSMGAACRPTPSAPTEDSTVDGRALRRRISTDAIRDWHREDLHLLIPDDGSRTPQTPPLPAREDPSR